MASKPKETPLQYGARRLCRSLELAKIAVMDAQERTTDFRGDAETVRMLTDAAFARLDRAWQIVAVARRDDGE